MKADSTTAGEAGIEQTLSEIVGDFPYGLPGVPRAQIARWLGALPFVQILEADAACEAFISERRWPELSRSLGEQIRVRLEGVLELCGMDALTSMDNMPLDEALRLLLVDFWHRKGVEWAEAVFKDGGNAEEEIPEQP